MPKVLVSDKLSKTAVQIFKDNGVEVDYLPDLGKDKDKLLEVIGQYDGLAIRSASKITEKIIANAKNLKVIGRAGIGVDNVDIPAATKKGIIVMNTPFGNSITTAEHAIALIAKSAPLHDIGKVGIPDTVLLKPGKLTPEEWEVMKTHARLGADAIARAVEDTHQPVEFLAYAHQIALHHHERWDGGGYPDGLAGEAIPLAARLMALADVFDALISRRVYKGAMAPEQARAIMAEQRGAHFDPDLLDVFLAGFDDFCAIAQRYPEDAA